MVKRIDNLGRIVIPIEVRRNLNLNVGEALLMEVEDNKIILSKQSTHCAFCGKENVLYKIKDKGICEDCFNTIKNI